jgi:hypothetical protein
MAKIFTPYLGSGVLMSQFCHGTIVGGALDGSLFLGSHSLFGNKHHPICCAEMMIMYAIEIVEGADMPPQKPWDPNERLGKTVTLLL